MKLSDVVVAFAPGAMDAMLALALTHIDPVFVGAHHLSRFVCRDDRRRRASCICSAKAQDDIDD